MDGAWRRELERPSAAFFKAFAARVAPGGEAASEAAREAVLTLTPVVDWGAYLPHVPHGLQGLQGVFRLRPLLAEASFLRELATQLHAFAVEARSAEGHGLGAIGPGSGHWGNVRMAILGHRPAIAWGEAMAVAAPAREDFLRLEGWAEKDMANVGHKPVTAWALGELFLLLGKPVEEGRMLLALAAWLCASEHFDTFWYERAARRLEKAAKVALRPVEATPAEHQAAVREVCDSGLVELLDKFSAWVRSHLGSGDLLTILVLAAAEKQLDARRDLEWKTSWNFVFLAGLAQRAQEGCCAPEAWVQAAALVNLFPTGEVEERPQPKAPRTAPPEAAAGLLDAILDGEPQEAMFLARALLRQSGAEAVLRVLAEAASANDPTFNHSHQVLAVAAGAELLPHLPEHAREALLVALAKALGNGQGSTDLGVLADGALLSR